MLCTESVFEQRTDFFVLKGLFFVKRRVATQNSQHRAKYFVLGAVREFKNWHELIPERKVINARNNHAIACVCTFDMINFL